MTTKNDTPPEGPPTDCTIARQGPVTIFMCGGRRRSKPPPPPVPKGRPVELLVDAMPKPKRPPARRTSEGEVP